VCSSSPFQLDLEDQNSSAGRSWRHGGICSHSSIPDRAYPVAAAAAPGMGNVVVEPSRPARQFTAAPTASLSTVNFCSPQCLPATINIDFSAGYAAFLTVALSTENPLLRFGALPEFSSIRPQHVVPAVDALLEDCRNVVARVTASKDCTWESVVAPLEECDDRLNKAWSPISHLRSVRDTPELRTAYNACLPKLSEYATEVGQNEALFEAFKSLEESSAFEQLDTAQKRVVRNALRDFRLAGVALDAKGKSRFKAISTRLSELSSKFEENVLDATQAWKKYFTDVSALSGLPQSAIAVAKSIAEREGSKGWMINLEFPSYLAVMTYADDEELRREVYEAYSTRASDEGPNAGEWDNSELMREILALRQESAKLLGYENYAELSLERKMAPSCDEVLSFIRDLASRAKRVAAKEIEELETYARESDGKDSFNAWDVAYYSEKLKKKRFSMSQEELRPYFSASEVVNGLFEVAGRLYGLHFTPVEGVDVWHPEVRFFEIHDENGELRGAFYLDLYARPGKRGGAWMDECRVRRRSSEGVQSPIAYLSCNFTPPTGGQPSLLTHDEVVTLFHEFGHGLHHMLTRVERAGVSGINGVEWDAVELPSQFMENFCWEREALSLFALHYGTRDPLPDTLYERMRAARNFHAGISTVRQLEFALFDFRLHLEHDAHADFIQRVLNEVREEVAVIKPPAFNRFAHGFSHVFAGGYGAGYYSYKWAEVLSSDAFSKFEERGIFDRETGREFLHAILEQGGIRDSMTAFVEFRGRKPNIDALLRHSGISTESETVESAA
jgi:oligopeptidase A